MAVMVSPKMDTIISKLYSVLALALAARSLTETPVGGAPSAGGAVAPGAAPEAAGTVVVGLAPEAAGTVVVGLAPEAAGTVGAGADADGEPDGNLVRLAAGVGVEDAGWLQAERARARASPMAKM
ncbi:MAG: hypothetical protein Q7R39_13310 [Dehalococcoidia bacterium]|nr:hypothetical protein [Dehalococcoidia bacterium]